MPRLVNQQGAVVVVDEATAAALGAGWSLAEPEKKPAQKRTAAKK